MASRHDYVPRAEAAFDMFFGNIVRYTEEKTAGADPPWYHIPQAEREALSGAYAAWHEAYEATLGPCTPGQRAGKRDARRVSEKILRVFVNRFLRYPPVTNGDRTYMGICNPDPVRSFVEVPPGSPRYFIVQLGHGCLGINYHHDGGRRGSRPPHVRGARIYYGIFDRPPKRPEEFTSSVSAIRCPKRIFFQEGDRGKRAYFALRWEIRKGDEGGWSEIEGEIIP
ncbi:MAG: hypothetical protein LBP23_04135 [Treponema sp.]|jgi:hypothetical protein|nr:hypothetical protein [Treponema sp.]